MNKNVDESSRQTAKMNRDRLATAERPSIFVEADKKAADVRENMARLRELRLAKEAREVPKEISTGSKLAKPKPRRRFK